MNAELRRLAEDVWESPVLQKIAATVLTIGGLTQVFNLIAAILGVGVAVTMIGKNLASRRKDNAMAAAVERIEERKRQGLPLRRKEDE